MLLIIPFALLPTIERAPDSLLSVAMSFIPPMNSIAMLARLGSATPPPLWQVLVSILAGLAVASVTVWFAAKVFRIGLLMHGKPPNLQTLIRWLRTD
jgi:ABC-2 type transport system permease protein